MSTTWHIADASTRVRALVLACVLVISACGGGSNESDEPAPGAVDAESAADDATPTETATVDAESAADDATPTETATGDAAAVPRGQALVEGLPAIEILGPPEANAGPAPLFSWVPVEGVASYRLTIVGPSGSKWAWSGPDTQVWLGGLDFPQPPGWTGPLIEPGSCWSVVARGHDGHVAAASEFLPVSPADSIDHTCTPGSAP